MKTAKYHEITKYAWDCPKCDHWNEEDEDPSYSETLVCEECQAEFEPEQE